jgi:hypothetical protein
MFLHRIRDPIRHLSSLSQPILRRKVARRTEKLPSFRGNKNRNGRIVTYAALKRLRLIPSFRIFDFEGSAWVTPTFAAALTRPETTLSVFRCFAQCALPKEGALKVDKLDRLPLLHIHRSQSKVRATLHSRP